MEPIMRRPTMPQAMIDEDSSLILNIRHGMDVANQVDGQKAFFARAGSVTKQFISNLVSLGANVPKVENNGSISILEGSIISYYCQTFSQNGGIIATDAPITRTVTLPSTGAYVLWIKGDATLSATIAAGTAVGTGWGSLTASGYLVLNITTDGTVTVTIANGSAGDLVQLTTGIFPTSYIPTPTTTPVSRASSGSYNTSNNGLTMPLTQQQIDSLTGELPDWKAAWSHVSGTAPTYSGGNKILTYLAAANSTDYHALSATIATGATIEIRYTITGYSAGSFGFGFGPDHANAGVTRSANGTYTERGTLATNTNIYTYAAGFTGVVTISDVRRVLDSGQTNRGEGTLIQWVDFPWSLSVVPNARQINFWGATTDTTIGAFYSRNATGEDLMSLRDGAGVSALNFTGKIITRFVEVSQWSSTTSQMRVGIYIPITDTLTWSSYAAYRGFFPITTTGGQRLRWGYGLGNLPIGIGGTLWFNRLLSSSEVIKRCKETRI